MSSFSALEVLRLVVQLGELVGRPLVALARQIEPRLREVPLPAVDDELDAARGAALARADTTPAPPPSEAGR